MTSEDQITLEAPAPTRPADASAEPSPRRSPPRAGPAVWPLAAIAVQLLLAVLVLRRFRLGEPGFLSLAALAWPAFCVHWLLPAKWRVPFFAALSLAAPVAILGRAGDGWTASGLLAAGCVIGAGLFLVSVCLSSTDFWRRAAMLTACGVVLAILHAGWIGPAALARAWPILASFFMFRAIVCLYDTSHNNRPRPGWAHTIAYFFMFPNAGQLLFPVVDFNAFTRAQSNEEPIRTCQRGMSWITRGIVQLLIHRLVVQAFSLPAGQVVSGADVVQSIVTVSLLYLRVSGQFHMLIGLLLLFGFNLPETNHRYFLASSFTDYWRRVNIYWKDFIMKVFYYPAFFRLKHLGQGRALVLATLFSFLMTWVLHAYQTWWLTRGSSISWPDTLFWGILAVLVVFNAHHELTRPRKRALSAAGMSASNAAGLCLRTAGTFTAVALLWSLWYSGSVHTWLGMWRRADASTLAWWLAVLAVIVAATLWFEVRPRWRRREAVEPSTRGGEWSVLLREGLACTLILAAIYPFGFGPILPNLPARLRPFAEAVATNSGADAVRGYYDRLMAAGPGDRNVSMGRPASDWRGRELTPNLARVQHGILYQTNRWGMRDDDVELAKPPGTVRILVLGSSNVFGVGVRQEQTFPHLLEARLNREPIGAPARVEVLNGAMPGYCPLNQIPLVQFSAVKFQPDIVLFVAYSLDYPWVAREICTLAKTKIPIPEPYLRQVMAEAGIDEHTNTVVGAARLMPRAPEILSWAYRRLVEECRAIGALPVGVFMPAPFEVPPLRRRISRQDARDEAQKALMRAAGFVFVDFSKVYDGHPKEELCLPDWDDHCTPRAHALVADGLYRQLLNDERIDFAGLTRRAAEMKPPGGAGSTSIPQTQGVR
ncbi:MAG: SGNH/GDSL hydrolase family protein [Phycisphaerae bacterium]